MSVCTRHEIYIASGLREPTGILRVSVLHAFNLKSPAKIRPCSRLAEIHGRVCMCVCMCITRPRASYILFFSHADQIQVTGRISLLQCLYSNCMETIFFRCVIHTRARARVTYAYFTPYALVETDNDIITPELRRSV